jgi:ABC-2 type transport system permease protein
MGALWNVVRNEWMKLVRRRRMTVVAVLGLCMIALFALGEYHKLRTARNYNPVQMQQAALAEMEKERASVAQLPPSAQRDEQLKNLDETIAKVKADLENAKVEAGSTADWRKTAQAAIQSAQQQLRQMPSGPGVLPSQQAERARTLADMAENQFRLDHNAPPIVWPHLSPWDETVSFLGVASQTLIPLLVVALVADIVAGEMTDGTIKLLVVRPVRRRTLLLGKWLVVTAASALCSLVLCGLMLLVGVLILGTQGAMSPHWIGVTYTFVTSPDQPLEVTPIPDYTHALLVPMWQYLLYDSLWIAAAMVVVASIAFFCSTVFQSSMVSTAVSMGAVIIGFVVTNMARHQGWVRWLFPTHLNLMSDWSGEAALSLQHPVTLGMGILVLAVWAVVLMAISFVRFGRQDILNA